MNSERKKEVNLILHKQIEMLCNMLNTAYNKYETKEHKEMLKEGIDFAKQIIFMHIDNLTYSK